MADRNEQDARKFNFTTESGATYECTSTEWGASLLHVTRLAQGALKADEFLAYLTPNPPVVGKRVVLTTYEGHGANYTPPHISVSTRVTEIVD